MNTGLLDVFHHGGDKGVLSVGNGIRLCLNGIFEIFINQYRPVGCHTHSSSHVVAQHGFIVNNFHTASAKNIGGSHHERVANAIGNADSAIHVRGHIAFGHGDTKLLHHSIELLAILCKINHLRRCTEDVDACLLELPGNIERSLSAKLADNAFGLFLFIDLQDVFDGKRLEVEFVGGVIIRGNGFGVAVDHNGFIVHVTQGECGMDTAVVELNPLSDPVGAAAKNHHLVDGVRNRDLVGGIVAGIVVRRIVHSADRHGMPTFHHTSFCTLFANIFFRHAKNLCQVGIGKAVLLGCFE